MWFRAWVQGIRGLGLRFWGVGLRVTVEGLVEVVKFSGSCLVVDLGKGIQIPRRKADLLIISMIMWIWANRLSIKNLFFLG